MSDNSINTTKRLAKNTGYMYFRMLLLMLISFYTSRVVLKQLGVEDYGIYNLVGSIVALFSSIRGLFSSSTQRFLNYEMGRGNEGKLMVVFNTSIYVNLSLAIFFFVAAEILGLWYLDFKAVIPIESIIPAHWVLQFSILTAIVTIMTTPFDAVIIAHEEMKFYAYLSIFESILKLFAVYMLSISPLNKLIFYSFLLFIVSVLIASINVFYCRKEFLEVKFRHVWDKDYFKRMAEFAGWNFFGNSAFTFTQNGLNMVLNFFGGPVLNAARGVANQVSSALQHFVSNIVIVIKPYCVKCYGEGERGRLMSTLFLSAKAIFAIQLCVALPFLFFTEEILRFWLGIIPDYSIIFLQLILINAIIRSLAYVIDVLFQAVGNLKYYQICEGIVLALPIPFSYLGLKYGASYSFVFICVIIFEIINQIACCIIAHKIAGLIIKEYLSKVIFPCAVCFSEACIMYFIIKTYYDNMMLNMLGLLLSLLVVLITMVYIGLNTLEREQLKTIVNASAVKILRQ